MDDLGLLPMSENVSFSRSFSLLPDGQSGHYSNSHENSLVFDHDDDPWFTMDTLLPFVHTSKPKDSHDWLSGKLRLSGSSPLFSVNHEMVLSITYSLDIPGTEELPQAVRQFSIPIRFVRIAPPPPPLVPLTHLTAHSPLLINTQPHGEPYAKGLPAYSQLFDSNGDRKIDYSVPLPLYSPTPSSSSASTIDLLDLGSETKYSIPA
jgi:hypothetical protein